MGGVHNLKYLPKFSIGQIVYHKVFQYRGVIFAVDFSYKGKDEQNSQLDLTRLERPWYYIMVDDDVDCAYVAESSLIASYEDLPIRHPLISSFFSSFLNGRYIKWRKEDRCDSNNLLVLNSANR